jgi:hypothetical protein
VALCLRATRLVAFPKILRNMNHEKYNVT